jgi:hypothetical protein
MTRHLSGGRYATSLIEGSMTTVWVSAVKSSVVAEDGRAITVTIDARNVGELSLLIQADPSTISYRV